MPTDHRLGDYQRDLDHRILQDLFGATVRELKKELPGLGETVAFDVKIAEELKTKIAAPSVGGYCVIINRARMRYSGLASTSSHDLDYLHFQMISARRICLTDGYASA